MAAPDHPFTPDLFERMDESDDRLFYYLAWPTAILLILLVANLRDSRTGRAWFAIRSSEVAASPLIRSPLMAPARPAIA